MGKDGEYITHFAYGTPAAKMTRNSPPLPLAARPISHRDTLSLQLQHRITI